MLKNFIAELPIGQITWELNPDVNILIGINGSGKTLTLQALANHCREEGLNFVFVPERVGLVFEYISDILETSLEEVGEVLKKRGIRSLNDLSKIKIRGRPEISYIQECFQEKDRSHWENNGHFSFGQLRFLAIHWKLMNESPVDIVIVDTPEMGLHLAVQKVFVDFIQALKPKSQLIISTHAPGIIMNWGSSYDFNKVTRMENILS